MKRGRKSNSYWTEKNIEYRFKEHCLDFKEYNISIDYLYELHNLFANNLSDDYLAYMYGNPVFELRGFGPLNITKVDKRVLTADIVVKYTIYKYRLECVVLRLIEDYEESHKAIIHDMFDELTALDNKLMFNKKLTDKLAVKETRKKTKI